MRSGTAGETVAVAEEQAQPGKAPREGRTAAAPQRGHESRSGEASKPAPTLMAGWGYFLLANLIAILAGWAIYEAIFLGDFLDPAFQAVHRYVTDHRVMGALAAAMPFFASLLVGFGYARRAARRRRRESAAARAQEERSKSLSNAS